VLIDAALTDVLAVILTIALMSILITHNASVQGTGKEILGSFSTGALIGGLLGLAWIALSKSLRKIDFFYMVTLAIILIAYITAEYFGGSGAIAALVIGIMLGNYKEIGQMLRFKNVADDAELLTFQNEFGFLVRSFYFVYLGSLVVIGNTYSLMVGGAIMLGLIVARYLSTKISTWGSPISKYNKYINAFMPRGLAAAVMGGYPAVVLLENQASIPPEVFAPLYAQALLFVEVAFVVIILSVVFTAVGAVLLRRGEGAAEKEEKKLTEEVEKRVKERGESPEGGNGESETSGD
jgi:cell volume regulation protein A